MHRLLQLCLARYVDDDKCSEEQVEQVLVSQLTFTCSNSTVETSEIGVKYVES